MSEHRRRAVSEVSAPRRGRTTTRRVLLTPTREQWIDLSVLSLLSLLALYGLRSTFGGWQFLIVGAAGLLLGVALGHISVALRQPLYAVIAAAVLTFFVLGGAIAMRQHTAAGVLPTLATLRGLGTVSVHGWKDLLTTLPPVGDSGSLMVIPYLLGLLTGVSGSSLVERTRSTVCALLAPALLLVVVLLLGTAHPVSLLAQGTAFAVLALGWAAMRTRRQCAVVSTGAAGRSRLVSAVAMLAVAGAVATLAGPHLPGSGSYRRVVLRDYITPPFDVSQYPSPLAAMRKYTKNGVLNQSVLFTEHGLPAGTPMRIATLDAYDGAVWTSANVVAPDGQTSTFQRIGETVETPISGRRSTVRVQIGPGYDNVWVPTAGELAKIDFASGPATVGAMRYNVANETAVLAQGLHPGDSYNLTLVDPAAPTVHPSPFGTPLVTPTLTSLTRTAISQWAGDGDEPWTQAEAIATHLRTLGKYSDGGGAQAQFLPGHGLGRLTTFLAGTQLVGNDEQYAAVFALMLNQIGFPARVVLGAVPEADGVVKGSDVHAWVEMHIGAGGSSATGRWLTIPTSAFVPDPSKTPDNAPPQTQQNSEGKVVPPPNSVQPPSSLENPDQPQTNASRKNSSDNPQNLLGLPVSGLWRTILLWALPILLVLGLFVAVVTGLKMSRRRRRSRRGTPVERLAAGWREVLDQARDLGTVVSSRSTRREQADQLPGDQIRLLATTADAGVFGAGEPSEEFVQSYWLQVQRTRRELAMAVSRRRRVRAALSLRSLRGLRSV